MVGPPFPASDKHRRWGERRFFFRRDHGHSFTPFRENVRVLSGPAFFLPYPVEGCLFDPFRHVALLTGLSPFQILAMFLIPARCVFTRRLSPLARNPQLARVYRRQGPEQKSATLVDGNDRSTEFYGLVQGGFIASRFKPISSLGSWDMTRHLGKEFLAPSMVEVYL